MKKKLSVLGVILLTTGTLAFIHYNNDHIECENVVEYSIGANGEEITTEKHICKERFNF
jgi:hypothetical protein